jgi:transcriptional regulator with XRE-family HTH domain
MSNLQFIRTETHLTTRQLGEMAGLSAAMVALLENGKRRFGPKSLEALSTALGTTPDFIEGKTAFGIYCDTKTEAGFIPLSIVEYQSQKRLGNITETIERNKPLTAKEIEQLKEDCPKDYQAMLEARARPFLSRTIRNAGSGFKREASALKEEAARLIQGMNEEQLEKALLMIKEVILK